MKKAEILFRVLRFFRVRHSHSPFSHKAGLLQNTRHSSDSDGLMSLSIGYCCLKYSPENLRSAKNFLFTITVIKKTALHLHDSTLRCCPIGSASDTPLLFLKSAGSIFWTGSHIKGPTGRETSCRNSPCPCRALSGSLPTSPPPA